MKKELLTLDEVVLEKALKAFAAEFPWVKPTKSAAVRYALECFIARTNTKK